MGKHTLRIVARVSNALGYVDSLLRDIALSVVDEYRILQLFNYPNPFASETYFSYVLTGARPPDEGTIRVFTVAGRKIRQIAIPSSSLQIGVNRVFWDGRDNDGDDVANGYYFYQVQVSAGDENGGRLLGRWFECGSRVSGPHRGPQRSSHLRALRL